MRTGTKNRQRHGQIADYTREDLSGLGDATISEYSAL